MLKLAAKYDTLIVEDDPYGDLYFNAAQPSSLQPLNAQVPVSRD